MAAEELLAAYWWISKSNSHPTPQKILIQMSPRAVPRCVVRVRGKYTRENHFETVEKRTSPSIPQGLRGRSPQYDGNSPSRKRLAAFAIGAGTAVDRSVRGNFLKGAGRRAENGHNTVKISQKGEGKIFMASAVARLLLTCRQASTLTGLSEAFWRKKIWLREIETVRFGRAVRIPASAVEGLIASGTIPAREQQQ